MKARIPSTIGALIALAALSLIVTAVPAGAQVTTETTDVVGQGPDGPITSVCGAELRRSDSGLSAHLRMSTPVSGAYDYPPPNMFQPVVVAGEHPEVYSLWLFAFNFPELCSPPGCGIDDLGTVPAMGGAFNAGGHVVGGPNLTLSGHVSMFTEPFLGSPLLEPRTAEVHLAVAPHGRLLPEFMPNQINFPIGSAPFWWLAFFPDGDGC